MGRRIVLNYGMPPGVSRYPVRNPQRAILRIVERQYLVLRLLDENIKPNGQIRTNHVHQTEASNDLVPINLDLFVVQEDEVHLDKDEGHTGGRRQGQQNVVALGVRIKFEILSKLQTRIDHAANSERCNCEGGFWMSF